MPHTLQWDKGVLLPPSAVRVFFTKDRTLSGEPWASRMPRVPWGSIREESGPARVPTGGLTEGKKATTCPDPGGLAGGGGQGQHPIGPTVPKLPGL